MPLGDDTGEVVHRAIGARLAEAQQAHGGRRLLSFDGGGCKAWSMVLILEALSDQIKEEYQLEDEPVLRDYLDMIGGVAVGAYLAILVGIFGLTALQVKEEYEKFETELLSDLADERSEPGSIDEGRLDAHLKDVVEKYTGNAETMMINKGSTPDHCRVFVICNPMANMSYVTKFTSYMPKKGQKLNCPIWQAIRATLALSRGFPPIEIGFGHFKQKYVGATLGTNNPSSQVVEEAKSMWRNERLAALISVGAGHEGIIQITDLPSPDAWNIVLERIATDTEKVVESLKHHFGDQNIYFRLSVEQGLQRGINMAKIDLGDIDTQTWAYLDSHDAQYLIGKVAKCLGENPASKDSRLSDSMKISVASGW